MMDTSSKKIPTSAEVERLKAKWDEAFAALRTAGLEHDADHPIAARYRAASNAVNHAHRQTEWLTTAQVYDSLYRFECRTSEDDAASPGPRLTIKTNLELACVDCDAHICDVEAGDALSVLARMASDHVCPPEEEA